MRFLKLKKMCSYYTRRSVSGKNTASISGTSGGYQSIKFVLIENYFC